MSEFKPHEIDWNDNFVSRLWDFYGSAGGMEKLYFSKHSGHHLIRRISRDVKFAGRILDYGCGPGHLINTIIQRTEDGMVHGLDFSEDSVRATEERLRGNAQFGGVVSVKQLPSGYEDGYFDVIVAVEVIEHLNDDYLEGLLNEVTRLLKPGGRVVFTTPNSEDLGSKKTMCPECGCIFHRWQHVRSWTPETLRSLLARHGFSVEKVRQTCFGSVARRLWYFVNRKPPHLYVVGVKAASA